MNTGAGPAPPHQTVLLCHVKYCQQADNCPGHGIRYPPLSLPYSFTPVLTESTSKRWGEAKKGDDHRCFIATKLSLHRAELGLSQ